MKLSISTLSVAALLAKSASSRPLKREQVTQAQVAAIAPPLGWIKGIPIAGSANCQGPPVNGVPSQIPCQCPPDFDDYIKNLTANANAGKAINNPSVTLSFPLGNSKDEQLARLNAASDTLQNLNGIGKGCPIVSTTFQAQNQAISNGQPIPPSLPIPDGPAETSTVSAATAASSAAASSARATSSAVNIGTTTAASAAASASASGTPGQLTEAQVAAVAPALGWKNGIPIAGSANCQGPPVNGVPSQIPCQCPPNQDDYIRNLTANANAGKAINNPSVKLSFPLGDSKEDQLARLNAASDTLQNLNGIGKGCPIVSTTFQAQNQAISAGQPIPPSLAIPNGPAATPAAKRSFWFH